VEATTSTWNITSALDPSLPAASPCVARAVYVPFDSDAVLPAVHADPERVAVSCWTGTPEAAVPANTSTRTVDESLAAAPAAPEKVGRLVDTVEPDTGDVSVGCGATVSIENVLAELSPIAPPESDCAACAVYVPSARSAPASTVHVVPVRVACSVCTGVVDVPVPGWTRTFTVWLSPAASPAAPAKVGVRSRVDEPEAGFVSVTAGAVVA
jgi:hypothetical protein